LDLFDQLAVESALTIDSVVAAIDTIQLMTTTNDLESDLKSILILSEPKWKGDTLTTTNVSGLNYFARQCPWLGGRSLVWGQKLYAMEHDSLLSAVPFDCPSLESIGSEEFARKESREVESFIKVWPNPVDKEIYVEAPSMKGILELYDTKGVQKLTMSFTGKQARVDVSGFLPGIYILVLRTEKNVYSYKINIL